MDVKNVADAVLYMASLPLERQCPVHDGDGEYHAVCGPGLSPCRITAAWRIPTRPA